MDTFGQNPKQSWDCVVSCQVFDKSSHREGEVVLDVHEVGLPRMGAGFRSLILVGTQGHNRRIEGTITVPRQDGGIDTMYFESRLNVNFQRNVRKAVEDTKKAV